MNIFVCGRAKAPAVTPGASPAETRLYHDSMRRILILLALTCLAFAQRRGVTAEDYFAFEQAGDPQVTPDGKWAAYTVTTVDQKANRRMTRIWIAALDGSHPPVPFTGETNSST